jgi:hypothetical protein
VITGPCSPAENAGQGPRNESRAVSLIPDDALKAAWLLVCGPTGDRTVSGSNPTRLRPGLKSGVSVKVTTRLFTARSAFPDPAEQRARKDRISPQSRSRHASRAWSPAGSIPRSTVQTIHPRASPAAQPAHGARCAWSTYACSSSRSATAKSILRLAPNAVVGHR